MKYAFIVGSNAFIIPHGAISNGEHDFLKINSIYHDTSDLGANSTFNIDLNIKDVDGSAIDIRANNAVIGASYSVIKQRDRIKVLRADGSTIIHVHQLDYEAAMGLEHNIVAELEVTHLLQLSVSPENFLWIVSISGPRMKNC